MLTVGLVGLLVGCSAINGDAPLPHGKGTINVDNPIERSQVGEVTAEGRAVTRRLVDALVDGGMVVGEKSFDAWRSCMSAKQLRSATTRRTVFSTIQYPAWIYLTPEVDLTRSTQLVQEVGQGWEITNDSFEGRDVVFALNLSITDWVRLWVMSP